MEDRVYYQPAEPMVTEDYGGLSAGKVVFLKKSDAEYWASKGLGQIVPKPENQIELLNEKLDLLIEALTTAVGSPARMESATVDHAPAKKQRGRPKKAEVTPDGDSTENAE